MNRNFYLLMQGQFISNCGTQMALMGTIFWLKQTTNSAALIGLLLALSGLPTLLLGPFGGTMADRYSRRKIVILCDAISGLIVGVLTFLIWAKLGGGTASVICILAANLSLACVNAFFLPAVAAIIPDLVLPEKVDTAMAWSQSLGFLSGLFGQGFSALILSWVAPYFLFFINAISFLFAAIGETFIQTPPISHAPAAQSSHPFLNFLRETQEGIAYVWKRQGMRSIFITAVSLNIFAAPLFVLLPFYATGILHRSMAWYGYLLAGWSLGSLLGYALGGQIRFERLPLFVLKMALCVFSGLLLSISWITIPGISWAWLFLIGILGAVTNLSAIRSLQKATEGFARGRVLGLWFTLVQSVAPLAMGLAGCIADYTRGNIQGILIVSGTASVCISLQACCDAQLSNFLVVYCLAREKSPGA